jgi:hypothetical protein
MIGFGELSEPDQCAALAAVLDVRSSELVDGVAVRYHSLRGYEARRGLCEDEAWLEIVALKGLPACSLSQRKSWPCVAAA